MIAARTGIVAPDLQNTAAYIASWLTALRNDNRLIVLAAGRAQKAADHILGTREEADNGLHRNSDPDQTGQRQAHGTI